MSKNKKPAHAVEQPVTKHTNSLRPLFIILFCALAVRIIYVQQIKSFPFFNAPVGDEEAYHKSAQVILNGDILAGREVFYQDPFYPYFLAVVQKVTGSAIYAPKVLQLGIGILSCLLIMLITTSVFGRPASLIAGAIAAVYPIFYFYEAQLQKPSLVVFFTLLTAFLLIRWKDKRQAQLVFSSGLLAGLSSVAQGHSYFFVPFILFWLFRIEKSLRAVFLFTAGIIIIVLPVALRNYSVSGDLVLTTYQAGTNFYIGNNEQANGIYKPLKEGRELPPYEELDAVELAESGAGRKLKPSEVSSYWFKESFKFITANPLKWTKLLVKKTAVLINYLEVPDVVDYDLVRERSFLFRVPLLNYGILCPLAAAGFIFSLRKKSENLRLMQYMTLAAALSLVLFYIFSRYRLLLVPFLIIFASYGLVYIREAFQKPELKKVAVFFAVFALFFAAGRKDLKMVSPGLGYGLLGNMAMENKDYEKAVDYFTQVLKKNPSNASLQSKIIGDIGRCYFEMRQYDKALDAYKQSFAIGQRASIDKESLVSLRVQTGITLQRKKEYDKAKQILEELKNEYPERLDIRTNLGTVYKKMKLHRQAITELQYVISKEPKNVVACNNLANLYRDTGDFRNAKRYYDICLSIDPQNAVVKKNIERLQSMQTQKAFGNTNMPQNTPEAE